jgi:hypothetical protein
MKTLESNGVATIEQHSFEDCDAGSSVSRRTLRRARSDSDLTNIHKPA